MKIKGRDRAAWHKNINDTVRGRRPTDADFPWIALQNQTGYYMKKKTKLSTTQVDERLLALIQNHPSKAVAIAACADRISTEVIRNLLVKDFEIEPDDPLNNEEYLQVIVATKHVNPGAVSDIEARWATHLLDYGAAGSPLAQQLHDVLSLLPARVGHDLLFYGDINRLADSVCSDFKKQLQDLTVENRWMEAHTAVGWLSTASTGSNASPKLNSETRIFLDGHLPRWKAWAAWQPHIPRLCAWKNFNKCTLSVLEDLLALEGPDFESITGSEKATLREGLIARGSHASQTTLHWGTTCISFARNPFRVSENLKGIFERLMGVMDFACSVGPEYTELLVRLYVDKNVNTKILQILEGFQILDTPTHTTAFLKAFTVPTQSAGQKISNMTQFLRVSSDSRVMGLHQQLQPYIADQISIFVRERQETLVKQLGERSMWFDAVSELLAFTLELKVQTWLLGGLDHLVQRLIASAPALMTMETLGDIRKSLRNTTSSTSTPLESQIDAYYRAQLVPGHTLNLEDPGVIVAVISLWQQEKNTNHRELALVIADLPHTVCQYRCDCLADISALSDSWVISTLRAFRYHDESHHLGCIALIRLLVSEQRSDVLERWRKVLAFAIKLQGEGLLDYAVTYLTTDMWFELLSNIRAVFKGSGVITDCRSPRLLSLELHTWSKKIADYGPTLRRLDCVLKKEPAKRVLLLGLAASKDPQLLRVLGFVENGETRYHMTVTDSILTRIDSENPDEIEDVLSVVLKATSKGAEACLRVLDTRIHVHPGMASVEIATMLRADTFTQSDRLALGKVAKLCGIDIDAEGYPLAASLREAAGIVHQRYLSLMTKAQHLENLRLSLRAAAPHDVSKLLLKVHIEAPSVVDDALASLPSSLSSLIGRVSEHVLELQFPATDLTGLQRFAIGAGDTESFLIRLTFRQRGEPCAFCIHLSAESSEQINLETSSDNNPHTPWSVFRSNNRPPHEQYCHNRPNIGAYQLSRILWRHLRHNFKSLEHTYHFMAAKISLLGQGCAVCGLGKRRLRRAAICLSPSCQSTFSKAPIKIQLAEIWRDPPVMDLLLSMVYATGSTGKLELLKKCPTSNASTLVSILDRSMQVPSLATTLDHCLNIFGHNMSLVPLIAQFSDGNLSEIFANILLWVCLSYRGFLVSATDRLRIPSFGSNQFLLANAAPELEIAFSRHVPLPQSESQILFHGTSLDRLHAILCQGLQVQSGTHLQRHGAVHGAGIYMADEPSVAWGYATAFTGGWKSSKLKNMKLLLGCELAGPKPEAAFTGVYVITDATRLAVRYIFLLESQARMPAAKDVRIPMKSVFQSLRGNTI